MAPWHTYKAEAREDSIDEEDRAFINSQFSEKKVVLLDTTTFNRVMGFVNAILALLLAVSLALVAITATHNSTNAVVVSVPYCKCSSAAPP